LLVSCSNDGVIKIWDIDQKSPTLIWEQTSNLGAIQCLAANPDNGFVFTVGGDNKEHNFNVLDLMEIPMGTYKFLIQIVIALAFTLINSAREICETRRIEKFCGISRRNDGRQ